MLKVEPECRSWKRKS